MMRSGVGHWRHNAPAFVYSSARPPSMSGWGQTEKNSIRANIFRHPKADIAQYSRHVSNVPNWEELSTKYVFRFAVELGHCSTESACLMSAHLPLVVRWALARADSIGIAGRALTSREGSRRRPSDRQP